eukprot:Opistho-2@38566
MELMLTICMDAARAERSAMASSDVRAFAQDVADSMVQRRVVPTREFAARVRADNGKLLHPAFLQWLSDASDAAKQSSEPPPPRTPPRLPPRIKSVSERVKISPGDASSASVDSWPDEIVDHMRPIMAANPLRALAYFDDLVAAGKRDQILQRRGSLVSDPATFALANLAAHLEARTGAMADAPNGGASHTEFLESDTRIQYVTDTVVDMLRRSFTTSRSAEDFIGSVFKKYSRAGKGLSDATAKKIEPETVLVLMRALSGGKEFRVAVHRLLFECEQKLDVTLTGPMYSALI